MEKKLVDFDIFDIAKTASVCSIAVGQNISEFGDLIGAPQYWGFVEQEAFSCYMGFGAMELFMEADGSAVLVRHISVNLHMSRARTMSISPNNRWGHSITITRPPYRDMTLEQIRKGADARGLVYTEKMEELVHPDTSAVMNFDRNVRFYFLRDKVDILYKIQLS